jgi:hypothetical protein
VNTFMNLQVSLLASQGLCCMELVTGYEQFAWTGGLHSYIHQ